MSQRYHVQKWSEMKRDWATVIQRDSLDEALTMVEHYRDSYPSWRVRCLDTATAALLDQLELPSTPETAASGPPIEDVAVDTGPGSNLI